MPNRMLTYLWATFGTLIASYLLLVVGTIYLASWQNALLSQVQDKESSIGELETRYYSSIAQLSQVNPASFGLVVPSVKLYAKSADAPALTRADE